MSTRPSVPAMDAVTGVSASTVHWRAAVAPAGVARATDSCPLMPWGAGVATAVTASGAPSAHVARVTGIGAQVQQRPAREVGPHDAVVGVEPLAHVGDDAAQVPEPALLDDLPHDVELGEEERPHRLHAEDPGVAGRVADGPGLGGVEPHGLLDEDVLARGDGEQRMGEVVVVRRRDVDDVDVRVGDERLVRAVRALHPPGGRGPLGGAPAARAHGRHDLTGVPTQRGDEPVGDPPGAEHPPAQRRRVKGVGDARARESRRHTA